MQSSPLIHKIGLFIVLLTYSIQASTRQHVEDPIVVVSPEEYKSLLSNLKDHIDGVVPMTSAELEENHLMLLDVIEEAITIDVESVEKSFELIESYDSKFGALFTTFLTQAGFNREYTSDGNNLHRIVAQIHQGLIDYAYANGAWLEDNPSLLDGKYFMTAQIFPGFVDAPSDPNNEINATVKCSYQLAAGSQPWADIGNSNVIRPTGCYLAPGSIAEVTVPESLIGKGINIRVGAHYWDLENKSRLRRLDRVSIVYEITEATTKIANPLGGGIYLEVPLGIEEGLVDLSLKNVVRSPFFSMKSFDETSLEDWQDTERNYPGPWTDFETDKFMMQVPTSWIYNFDDPKTLLEDWDMSMDIVSDLLGRPKVADRHKNYLQFDVIIRGGAYFPGYPMSNTPYNPNHATNGVPTHNIMKGPQFEQAIHFHELGHEVAISKFSGETEALVNFLYVAVLNKGFGYSMDEAFYLSFPDYWPYLPSTRDNITRTRLVADSFYEGLERNICNCTKNEVRYQHRGYAHYVDVAELFGWEALESFWSSENDAAAAGNPFPVNDQNQDDRIFRMSKAADVDLRPLFHFWGIHPDNPEELDNLMTQENLELSDLIKCRLHEYRDLIPANYDEFVAFAQELYPDFLEYTGTNFDYGEGWYQQAASNYDETRVLKTQQAIDDILTLYYEAYGAISALNLDCLDVMYDNNAGITQIIEVDNSFCAELNFVPTVEFANFSSEEMTQATFELYRDQELVQTLTWNGSLELLEKDTLYFDNLTIESSSTIEARITTVNELPDLFPADNSRFVELEQLPNTSTLDLLLHINTDNYPQETSWEIVDNAGNVVSNGGNYTITNNLYIESISLADHGCYTFTIYDTYGDGICCGQGEGLYELFDLNNNLLFSGGLFAFDMSAQFAIVTMLVDADGDGFTSDVDCDDNNADVNPDAEEIPNNGIDDDCDGDIDEITSSVHELGDAEIRIYPNPASKWISIQVSGPLETLVNIYDMNGKIVLSDINPERVNVETIPTGIYLIEIKDQVSGKAIMNKVIISHY